MCFYRVHTHPDTEREGIPPVSADARKKYISLAFPVLKAGFALYPKNPQEVYRMGYSLNGAEFLINARIIN